MSNISTIATAADRDWATNGTVVASDIPGISYLRQDVDSARVEVYSAKNACGSAAVIIGRACHAITPTLAMRDAYLAADCSDAPTAA